MIDISERKQTEEALAAEKERLTVTLRSIGDGVITTDTEGRVVLINQVAEMHTGWSQEEGRGRRSRRFFAFWTQILGSAARVRWRRSSRAARRKCWRPRLSWSAGTDRNA